MLFNQTLDKLDALGLFGIALGLREQLESNQYLSLSFDERLGLLVDREAELRDNRRLALRLKAAKLRQEATVEHIDFRAPRGLDRSVIMNLAQAGWVAARHNLLVTGLRGVGKTVLLNNFSDLAETANWVVADREWNQNDGDPATFRQLVLEDLARLALKLWSPSGSRSALKTSPAPCAAHSAAWVWRTRAWS